MLSQRTNGHLTVIIPTYNEGLYLKEALESLKDQDVDAKFLISDNCSTDDSREIALEFCRLDKRFVLFCQPNNIGSAQNGIFLINKINTEFFFCLGAHDKISPGFLSVATAQLAGNPEISMVCGLPQRLSENGLVEGIMHEAIYDFMQDCRLTRYINSVLSLTNCTCFHSVYRTHDLLGLNLKTTISCDHVFISHFLWKGKLLYLNEFSYFRRFFESRQEDYARRLTGQRLELSRYDFYDYYLESFNSWLGKSIVI